MSTGWLLTGEPGTAKIEVHRSFNTLNKKQKRVAQSVCVAQSVVSHLVCFVQSVLPWSLPVWAGLLWWTLGWEQRTSPAPGELGSPLGKGCQGSGHRWSAQRAPLSDWEMPGHSWESEGVVGMRKITPCPLKCTIKFVTGGRSQTWKRGVHVGSWSRGRPAAFVSWRPARWAWPLRTGLSSRMNLCRAPPATVPLW